MAAPHECVDIALSLSFLKAVFRNKLRYKIVVPLERGHFLLREFAPLRPDFLKEGVLGLVGGLRWSRKEEKTRPMAR
jgi:hypothetical protein